MIITVVPKEGIPQVWAKVAPLIYKALPLTDITRASILDIYEWCLAEKFTLWVVADEETKEIFAATVTRILDYPAYRALSVQYLGGERMNEWLGPAFKVFERYAKDSGCRSIEGYGREAWIRALEGATGREWKKVYALFELDLGETTEVSMAAE